MPIKGILLAIIVTGTLLISPALSWGETSVFQASFGQDDLGKENYSEIKRGDSPGGNGEVHRPDMPLQETLQAFLKNDTSMEYLGKNISVCQSGCNCTSIQAAVCAARKGDKIIIHNGYYNESIFLTKDLEFVGLGDVHVSGGFFSTGYSISISGFGLSSINLASLPDIDTVEPDGAVYWYLKGNQFKSNASDKEALKCYNKAVQLDPIFVLAWNKKAMVLENMSRYKEAIDALDRATAIDPYWSSLWHNKGVAYYGLKRYDEAAFAYDRAIELDPDASDTLNLKGNALHSLGMFEEALECYNKSLELDPRNDIVWGNKGRTLAALGHFGEALLAEGASYHISGEYAQAVEAYDEAIRINSKSALAWYFKGNALFDWGRYGDAASAYDAAIAINPASAEAWYKKGKALYKAERYGEAVNAYVQAAKTNSQLQYPDVHSMDSSYPHQSLYSAQELATSALSNIDSPRALEALILALENTNITVRTSAAMSLGNIGEAKAVDPLLQALNDSNVRVRINAAEALGKINDPRALDALAEALGDEDDYVKKAAALAYAKIAGQPERDTAREWNNEGTSLYDSQDYEGAVRCFDLAVALNPLDKIAWNNKGMALERLNKNGDALDCYDRALEIDGTYALAWENKGYALKALGKSAEAEDAFAKASHLRSES